jgi:hypothetical protein
MATTSSVDLSKRIEELKAKLDQYRFEICRYIADVIMNHEAGIYSNVGTEKVLTKLNQTTEHQLVLPIVAKTTEMYFNNIFSKLKENKEDGTIQKIISWSDFFHHSRSCVINMIARICLQTHLKLNRKNIIYDTNKLYLESVKNLLNGCLNELFLGLMDTMDEFCDGNCNDDVLKDVKEKGKEFLNFKLDFE